MVSVADIDDENWLLNNFAQGIYVGHGSSPIPSQG